MGDIHMWMKTQFIELGLSNEEIYSILEKDEEVMFSDDIPLRIRNSENIDDLDWNGL
jgi:hypothetical protein